MPNVSGLKWGDPRLGSPGGVVTWSIASAGLPGVSDSFFTDRSDVTVDADFPFNVAGALKQAFRTWSAEADIVFARVDDDGSPVGEGLGADIRIYFGEIDGPGDGSVVGLAFFPPVGVDALSGDILFDSDEGRFFADRQQFLAVAIHEIGHTLGLDHVGRSDAIMNPVVSDRTTLFPDDIDGITQIYGEPQERAPLLKIAEGAGPDLTLRERLDDLTIRGDTRDNALKGGGGGEMIQGRGGDDHIRGGGGDDTLIGGAGDDLIDGGGRTDVAMFRGDYDQFDFAVDASGLALSSAAEGADTITGRTEAADFGGEVRSVDHLIQLYGAFDFSGFVDGGAGPDADLIRSEDDGAALSGLGGRDRLFGGDGADTLKGGSGRDTLIGGAEDDRLSGGGGRDAVDGGGGADRLNGGGGRDQLNGGAGDDTLNGGGGADSLEGGPGDDRLIGGAGRDVFVYRQGDFGLDRIVDFQLGADRIDLGAGAANGLADLTLRAAGDNLRIDADGGTILLLGDAEFEDQAGRLFLF